MEYQHKREQTRARICDAFVTLYREHDIAHISVRQICELAGINRSTFYTYYTDVYDLLAKMTEQMQRQLRGTLAAYIREPTQPLDLNRIVAIVIAFVRESDGLPLLLMRRGGTETIEQLIDYAEQALGAAEAPENATYQNPGEGKGVASTAQSFVDRAQISGTASGGSGDGINGELDPARRERFRFALRYHLSGTVALVNDWEQAHPGEDAAELVTLISRLATRGPITLARELVR